MAVMPEETARVLRVEGEHALILRERNSVCQLCPDPDECSEDELDRCGIEIRALNRAGAKEGDLVAVRLEGAQVLLAIVLVYGLPLVFMGLGLYGVAWAASSAGVPGQAVQGLAALGLLAGLVASVPVSRQLDKVLYRTGTFTPVIEEVREAIEV